MAQTPGRARIGLVQLAVGSDKATNLSRAVEKVREASQNGANIVALPVYTCDYHIVLLVEYAVHCGASCVLGYS